jgi:hypothetical protein
MENLPAYISWVFIATTLLTLFFLYKASRQSKAVVIIALLWLVVQSIIANSKFYTQTQSLPPRFLLLVVPPLLLILILFVTAKSKAFIDRFDTTWLTGLHIVRIPVEIVLFWLFVQQQIPQLMTFEGRNFDILSGLTAPLVAYFGYYKQKLNTAILLAWNFLCLALLINIVANAVLAAPFPFQQFAFEQPNVAVLYFPFALLPAFIVPAVLFAHLVCIRQLLSKTKNKA